MKLKTGIEKLDDILKGGVPEKSSILLIGPPKSGKTLFGIHFLFEGLKNSEHGICIITNNFPEKFVNELEKFGAIDKILQEGLLKFVDCYSVHVGVEKENTLFIIRVSGPTALSEISIALTKILENIPKEKNIRIVFDSLSTLLLYNSSNVVARFVQIIEGKAKASGANSIFIVEEGAHPEQDIATLSSMLDAILRLKTVGKQNLLEIKGFGLLNAELNYNIEDGKLKC